jgi:hypothetical protein
MKCVEEAVSLYVRAQPGGASAGSRWILTSAKPERTSARWSRTEIFSRRQLFTTERIAATFSPARGLPMCNQFFSTESYRTHRVLCQVST